MTLFQILLDILSSGDVSGDSEIQINVGGDADNVAVDRDPFTGKFYATGWLKHEREAKCDE